MANLPMPEGLTNKDLECVMLDLPSLDVLEAYGSDVQESDLYFSYHPELKYAQGDVASKQAHVTLLFGIHPSPSYVEDVYGVLTDWTMDEIVIGHVGHFPSRVEGQDYNVIVGHVMHTAPLLAGHRRLQALPHTNQFDEYKPHVTLAYIKGEADVATWVERMNAAFAHRALPVLGLNLGLED